MSRQEFDKLIEGLLYLSETDAPLAYYELDQEATEHWPPATPTQFLQMIGEDTATPVEELAPDKFFEDLKVGNEDREDQINTLRSAFQELESVRGYRVGQIQIKIFILGKDASSERVSGLQTLSVET